MTNFLIRRFAASKLDAKGKPDRQAYGLLSGFVGIVINLLLFISKLVVGFISNSLAIIADAFNNLSDFSSSLATVIGFHFIGKPADKEHPFGHGRIEYITALFISVMILFVGFQFILRSIEKIRYPSPTLLEMPTIIILMASILLKLWMAMFNIQIAKHTGSLATKATIVDSFSDIVITGLVLASMIIEHFFQIQIDGYAGLFVALVILYGGIQLIRETLTPILGGADHSELHEQVTSKLQKSLDEQKIIGYHDLLFHDYGMNKIMATVHVVLPPVISLEEAHQITDSIEREIVEQYHIELLIHPDPAHAMDDEVVAMKERVSLLVRNILSEKLIDTFDIHDFHIMKKEFGEVINFDLALEYSVKEEDAEIIKKRIEEELRREYSNYIPQVKLERTVF